MLGSYAHAKKPELVEASIKWPFIGMAAWIPIGFIGFILIQNAIDDTARNLVIVFCGVLCVAVFMAGLSRCMTLIDRAYEEEDEA